MPPPPQKTNTSRLARGAFLSAQNARFLAPDFIKMCGRAVRGLHSSCVIGNAEQSPLDLAGIIWVGLRSLNGTASWTPVLLDRVMDRCDRDRWWDHRLALFCSTKLRSLGIGNRWLGHHCLAWGPCDPVLACWSISIEYGDLHIVPTPSRPRRQLRQRHQDTRRRPTTRASSSRRRKGELQRSGNVGLEPLVASIVRQACGPEWIGRSPKTR